MRTSHLLWLSFAVLLAGCPEAKYRTILNYNFSSDMPESPAGYHYEHFATINGSVVSLGTFRVRYDVALNKFDVDASGVPYKRRAVVSLDYLAYGEGDENWGDAKCGAFFGVLDGSDPSTNLPVGGIEYPTATDCTGATEIFITVEPDPVCERGDDGCLKLDTCVGRGTALPSHDMVLDGYLDQRLAGNTWAGDLTNPAGYTRIKGHVAVEILTDEAI